MATDSAGHGDPALHERRHLRRLDRLFEGYRAPVFFLTQCVRDRAPVLADHAVARVLTESWRDCLGIPGWRVGSYVIMPDHVHFFAAPNAENSDLSAFVGAWKSWPQRRLWQIRSLSAFFWQREFHDHLLRSNDSYAEKWEYVRQNPVRAGLVDRPEDWPYQGEIHPVQW